MVLYGSQYYGTHCTFQAFEQFESLPMRYYLGEQTKILVILHQIVGNGPGFSGHWVSE